MIKYQIPKDIVCIELTIDQPKDCMSNDINKYQSITIKIEDGGGGEYALIKTSRFAFDEGEMELICELMNSMIENCQNSKMVIK